MISKEAEVYILHQCLEHGSTAKEVTYRWSKTYPEDAFTEKEVTALLADHGVKPPPKKSKKAKKTRKGA